jgi:pimeloyl-ACP methyl ester carboxylesterase
MNIASRLSSVIYFHGLPGSADELALLELEHGGVPTVLDPLDLEDFDRRHEASAPLTVIGFSLGAFSALKLAVARPASIADLVLISPAGPLEMGPFLGQMAGAPVFKMAKASSTGFAILTAAQALAAHAFPRLLLNQMFANSCDAEKALLRNPAIVRCLANGLKHSLWDAAPLYRRTLTEYVQPWETELSRVRCTCQVFHGELDNWVPVEMAQALFDRLPAGSQFQLEKGLGHYSTLIKVLPSILSRAM